LYLYREIYKTRRLVQDHAAQINALSEGETFVATICDHDAEDRATLERYGIRTTAASKAVSVGLQATQARMRVQEDGKPRVFVMRGALVERDIELEERGLPTCTAEEIPGYVWADSKRKEEPVKEDDHGCDAMRYMVMAVDSGNQSRAAVASVRGLMGGRRRVRS
jgi:hypothetical protein